ncbi:MAG: ATP-binding protein [Spirulinaceae cyanobacterium]
MTPIDQLIAQEANPFDAITLTPGNFWKEEQKQELVVDSIHRELITEIERYLDLVGKDGRSRSLLLIGDSGTGKSYLLGRVKKRFNTKAFFAYIGPWPDGNYIWRHTLRYLVDSLMYKPENQAESQLLLWLKGLLQGKEQKVVTKLLGERQLFVNNLRSAYPIGIYKSKEFFTVLYNLTQPELYPLCCDWLKGDDLDDEDKKRIGVKYSIDNEEAAQKIVDNFGRIAQDTQPIVLCFDNLDNIPLGSDGFIDLQSLFSANSTIHNQYLKNFLIIISLVKDTWRQHSQYVQAADRARIVATLTLKLINLDQAEALWCSRLYPLHQQLDSPPKSPLFPLSRKILEEKHLRGKTNPRLALKLGSQLYQNYKNELKEKLIGSNDLIGSGNQVSDDNQVAKNNKVGKDKQVRGDSNSSNEKDKHLALFKLIWQKEFNKIQKQVTKVSQFSSPELVKMLQEALAASQVTNIETKLLTGKYSSYSFKFAKENGIEIGVVWSEDANLSSFSYLMKACKQALKDKQCQSLFLIRDNKLGTANNKGYQLYKQIFIDSHHQHHKPNQESVCYLATYHSLVNAARSGELVVGDETPDLIELEHLVTQTKVLENCQLLQRLLEKVVVTTPPSDRIKEIFLNLMMSQQLMGKPTLLENANVQFPEASLDELEIAIEELCQEQKLKILDPSAKPEALLICWVPQR